MRPIALVGALLFTSCATLEHGPMSPTATIRCRDSARRRDCRECCRAHTDNYGGLTWSASVGEASSCKCYEKKKEAE